MSNSAEENAHTTVDECNEEEGKLYERLLTAENLGSSSSGMEKSSGPSNQVVLGITCASFALFVIAEIIGALAGNSLSLLGDAAAMSVDVFTYLTNMIAECIKSRGGKITWKLKFLIEVIVPSFSVCALMGVTGYVTKEAIIVLFFPSQADEGDDVSVVILFAFSGANMFVDLVSGLMFYCKGKQGLLHTPSGGDEENKAAERTLSMESIISIAQQANLVTKPCSHHTNS